MNEWIADAIKWAVGALGAWATWLTLRSFNSLSRREHERLCERRQRAVDEQLARLHEKQDQTLQLLIDVLRDR